jgi:hypothetical protein
MNKEKSTPVIMCLCSDPSHDGRSCDKCKAWKSKATRDEMIEAVFPFTFKSTGNLDNYCPICGISAFDHLHEAGKKPKEFVMLGDGSVRCCDNGDMDEDHQCLKQAVNGKSNDKKILDRFYDLYRDGRKNHKMSSGDIDYFKASKFLLDELDLQKKHILDILVDEINIANTHDQPTMRITSAYNRIKNLK